VVGESLGGRVLVVIEMVGKTVGVRAGLDVLVETGVRKNGAVQRHTVMLPSINITKDINPTQRLFMKNSPAFPPGRGAGDLTVGLS
jgi:hypothetical protein